MHLDLQLIHLLLAQASSEMVSMEGWLTYSFCLLTEEMTCLVNVEVSSEVWSLVSPVEGQLRAAAVEETCLKTAPYRPVSRAFRWK